jgi:hypothetical protein
MQQYCSQGICQNIRKSRWRNTKLKNDPDYLDNRNAASKRWRKNNGDYWRKYRTDRSKYIKRGRQLDAECNLHNANPQVPNNASLFANSDANSDALNDAFILKIPIKTGTYKLIPGNATFANSDALLINIAIISNGYERSQFANIPPYSQHQ